MTIEANCSFKRRYFYSMGESNGKFRGKGIIKIDDESVLLQGKRVYSLPYRFFFSLLTAIIPSIILHTYVLFIPLLLISGIFVEYFLLKEEKANLKWREITKYEIATSTKTIAFSVEGNSAISPVAFQSPEFENVAAIFRTKIPDREKTAKGLKAMEERYDDQINGMAKFIDKHFK